MNGDEENLTPKGVWEEYKQFFRDLIEEVEAEEKEKALQIQQEKPRGVEGLFAE